MSNILNQDILLKIFGFLAYAPSDYKQWSKQLPLLAVCSSWRKIALPLVYKVATINIYKPAGQTSLMLDTNNSACSNVHLAASVGCIGLMRHFNIQIGCNILQTMDVVLSILHKYQAVWKNINTAYFLLEHQNLEYKDDGSLCKPMASKIASTFPLLKNILLRSNKKRLQDARLFGALAGMYSAQLTSLASNVPIIIEPRCKFARLKKLVLAIDTENPNCIPSINADTITSLQLIELSNNFAWNEFCDSGDSKEIVFTNLQNLSLTYQNEHVYEKSKPDIISFQIPKFYFPNLQNLNVNYSDQNVPLLFSNAALKASISVHAPIETLGWLQNGTQINKLTLWAICNSKTDMSSQMTKACKLASQANTREDVMISIIGNDVFNLPLKVEFQYLTHIHCYSPVHLNTIFNVVELVPSLVLLKCVYVIAEISSDELCSIGDSQINELLLMFSVQQPETDEWVVAVQRLLLKLTKLKLLALHGFPTALLYNLVDTHSIEYPHLLNISLQ